MRLFKWLLPVLALAFLLLLAGDAWACPGCKEAIAAQPRDASRMREGYFWSILFMMAMPFLLLGTGSFFVVRAVKRGALPQL
jgi:hypothetical protein